MNDLEATVAETAAAFESLNLPYMLIGGLAVSAWGEPRTTLDVDWTVWVERGQWQDTILRLCERFQCLPEQPVEFVEQTRVLPIRTPRGARVDVVFASLPWERKAISRAKEKQIAERRIPVASVEDLILMKLLSEREKDLEDARRLLRRFGGDVDAEYLQSLLEELADALARPDIMTIWNERS